MVTAFKNRPFIPEDTARGKSNLQIFEEVVKDSIASFTTSFDAWFLKLYNFSLYKENSSSTGHRSLSLTQQFDNVRALLYETNENVFHYKEPETYKQLEKELKDIEEDYWLIPQNQENYSNAAANAVQQSLPPDSTQIKRNEIQQKLEAFEKKLRKMIFDRTPKKAN